MKFFSFHPAPEPPRLGAVFADGMAVDLSTLLAAQASTLLLSRVPRDMRELIELSIDDASLIARLAALPAPERQAFALDLDAITWCAPIARPTKNVFCVGRNYKAHIIEGNVARGRPLDDFPKAVEFFTKPPTAVVGHLAPVSRHAGVTEMLDYEIELGVVIGKAGANISEQDAWDHVFGYTIVNDVTGRDLQARHGQWFKGKALDRSCPIGPFFVPKAFVAAPENLNLKLRVNGELRQDANSSDLLFKIPQIIQQLSAGLTLEPGDVIATGTPSGVGLGLNPQRFLQPGDVVAAEIESLGELINTIV